MKNHLSSLPAASLSLLSFLMGSILTGVLAGDARATILTFRTDNAKVPAHTSMNAIQNYGDNVAAASVVSGASTFYYEMGNGWTPYVTVSYSTQSATDFPEYYGDSSGDTVWPGVVFLWSAQFTGGEGKALGTRMPVGYEYYVTFTPASPGKGVVLNSFVLRDYPGRVAPGSPPQLVDWRVVRGTPAGAIVASGSATLADGEVTTIPTGMTAGQADKQPLVLAIRRNGGTEDDLALDDIDFDEAQLLLSYNTGSLGSAADAYHTPGVVLDEPGAISAATDYSCTYSNQERTVIPYRPDMNPPSSSPFTIEFWARPTASDNDDAPVFNRVSDGNRSGWVFFQRAAATGWNFRMYDGNGSNVGWDLTGGTAPLEAWSHVVAVWTGSSARLYVNGTLASTTNASGRSGVYAASTSANFSVGAYDTGLSSTTGSVDDIAFYGTALSAARILAHYNAAASPVKGFYASQVKADGPLTYLQQNPPELSLSGPGPIPAMNFTGVLSQSADLLNWHDLNVTSPFTPANPQPGRLCFRAHR